jgi:serine/threonine-protein kinase HipA
MAYYDMATMAGIGMMSSELIEIGGEKHFLTERYDRKNGEKVHTVSLAGMMPDATSYEQLMEVCLKLQLPYKEREEVYRRAVFNMLTTNVDAHIRNFEFMLEKGHTDWHISPAYDLTFSCFNPHNKLDEYHYLSMNGKRTGVNHDDMLAFARRYMIDNPNAIIKQCVDAVMEFRAIATKYGVSEHWQDVVERHFAEMTPDLLSGLQGYKPHVFSYVMENGVHVEDAQWQEMGNGAFRLTARIKGVEYRATVSPKSPTGKRIADCGGIKMSEESLRQFVNDLLLPKITFV